MHERSWRRRHGDVGGRLAKGVDVVVAVQVDADQAGHVVGRLIPRVQVEVELVRAVRAVDGHVVQVAAAVEDDVEYVVAAGAGDVEDVDVAVVDVGHARVAGDPFDRGFQDHDAVAGQIADVVDKQ